MDLPQTSVADSPVAEVTVKKSRHKYKKIEKKAAKKAAKKAEKKISKGKKKKGALSSKSEAEAVTPSESYASILEAYPDFSKYFKFDQSLFK